MPKKKFRRSELVNKAPNMDRKLKMEELRKIDINERHYDNVITKQETVQSSRKNRTLWGCNIYTKEERNKKMFDF